MASFNLRFSFFRCCLVMWPFPASFEKTINDLNYMDFYLCVNVQFCSVAKSCRLQFIFIVSFKKQNIPFQM